MPKNEPNLGASSELFNGELKHVIPKLRNLYENDFKVGQILFENRSYLNRDLLGSLLGNKTSKQMLEGYLSQFNFKNAALGPCLKDFLEQGGFNLPQEHELIKNLLLAFSNEFISQNPDNEISSNVQDLATLVFGTLLLNTDLTSSSIKQKMTDKEFVNNMMEIGDMRTLQDDIKIKEKKLNELMNKKSKDRDQKTEVQSLLVGYQEREKMVKEAQERFKEIYEFIKENPLDIKLSKDFKKEKHHKKISRTLSLLFTTNHFEKVMKRPGHTNKELNKSARPKND